MKKRFSKKLFGLLPIAAAAIVVPTVLTSCSNTSSNGSVPSNVTEKKFNALQTTTTFNTANTPSTLPVYNVDPNINTNAQDEAYKTFAQKLTKDNLQKDFDLVLSKFYNAYEYENETTGDTEIEAEVERIKVDSVTNKEGKLTASLSVTYDVEVDVEDGKDEEGFKTQVKELELKPMFATNAEIEKITKMLESASNKGDSSNGDNTFEVDADDLYELYVGDKEDNEKSVFEQVGSLMTQSKYGGLLGYSVQISKLAYTPESSTYSLIENRLTGDEEIFAPSTVIKDFYVPEMPTTIASNGIDLTLSYSKISTKTKEELMQIKEVAKLSEILFTPIPDGKVSLVNSISWKEDTTNNGLILSVQLKSGSEGVDATSIGIVQIFVDNNWLKPSTTVSPSPEVTPSTPENGQKNN